jgi:hypothetical protein
MVMLKKYLAPPPILRKLKMHSYSFYIIYYCVVLEIQFIAFDE